MRRLLSPGGGAVGGGDDGEAVGRVAAPGGRGGVSRAEFVEVAETRVNLGMVLLVERGGDWPRDPRLTLTLAGHMSQEAGYHDPVQITYEGVWALALDSYLARRSDSLGSYVDMAKLTLAAGATDEPGEATVPAAFRVMGGAA